MKKTADFMFLTCRTQFTQLLTRIPSATTFGVAQMGSGDSLWCAGVPFKGCAYLINSKKSPIKKVAVTVITPCYPGTIRVLPVEGQM